MGMRTPILQRGNLTCCTSLVLNHPSLFKVQNRFLARHSYVVGMATAADQIASLQTFFTSQLAESQSADFKSLVRASYFEKAYDRYSMSDSYKY